MSNERQFREGLRTFETESYLPPIIFDGHAVEIKRVLLAYPSKVQRGLRSSGYIIANFHWK